MEPQHRRAALPHQASIPDKSFDNRVPLSSGGCAPRRRVSERIYLRHARLVVQPGKSSFRSPLGRLKAAMKKLLASPELDLATATRLLSALRDLRKVLESAPGSTVGQARHLELSAMVVPPRRVLLFTASSRMPLTMSQPGHDSPRGFVGKRHATASAVPEAHRDPVYGPA